MIVNEITRNMRMNITVSSLFMFAITDTISAQFQETGIREFSPRTYVVHKADQPVIIDGKVGKEVWQDVERAPFFLDIQGEHISNSAKWRCSGYKISFIENRTEFVHVILLLKNGKSYIN
ncbi:MAG: hypothetical protein EA391_12530 [Balneolaceae bacterium]|nr:MAG: hypothetical protein EA391_12530 [Balneolaceae bacterium]